MAVKLRFRPRHTETTAAYAYILHRNRAERIGLRDYLILKTLADSPRTWDRMIREGASFSAIPVNPEAIRRILGIRKGDTTVGAHILWGLVINPQ